MQGGRKTLKFQYLAIARKRLKIHRYMLLCVWQALNPLFIHVTLTWLTAIVPGAYPEEAKIRLRLIAETDARTVGDSHPSCFSMAQWHRRRSWDRIQDLNELSVILIERFLLICVQYQFRIPVGTQISGWTVDFPLKMHRKRLAVGLPEHAGAAHTGLPVLIAGFMGGPHRGNGREGGEEGR